MAMSTEKTKKMMALGRPGLDGKKSQHQKSLSWEWVKK